MLRIDSGAIEYKHTRVTATIEGSKLQYISIKDKVNVSKPISCFFLGFNVHALKAPESVGKKKVLSNFSFSHNIIIKQKMSVSCIRLVFQIQKIT